MNSAYFRAYQFNKCNALKSMKVPDHTIISMWIRHEHFKLYKTLFLQQSPLRNNSDQLQLHTQVWKENCMFQKKFCLSSK